jgi:putative photosynthetic complex assembly protein
MSALDSEQFPRGALIAIGALVGLSLIATTAVRLERLYGPPATPLAELAPAPATSVDLRFSDEADGSIRIIRAVDSNLVASVRPGEGGFIRGVMRGLARDRISRHIGAKPPFRLSLNRDGSLWLLDTATGRLIDLDSFGLSNRDSFRNLLGHQFVGQKTNLGVAPIVLSKVSPR